MKENVMLGSYIVSSILIIYYLLFGWPNMYATMVEDHFSMFRIVVCIILLFIVIMSIFISIHVWAENIDRKRKSKRHHRRNNNE